MPSTKQDLKRYPLVLDAIPIHGAAKHTDVTRELFIPPDGYTNGTPTATDTMDSIEFVDAAVKDLHLILKVPDDFVSFVSVKLVWVAYVAIGNMYWRLISNYRAEGEIWNAHQDDPGYGITATGGNDILNVQEPGNPLTLANLTKGDYVGIHVKRDATHANDTIDAEVFILGFLFTYVADE